MRSTTRRDFLSSIAGRTAALPLLSSCTSNVKSNRSNILFIQADDHAAHALSCYGSKINKTPNLDRIASEGMRFDNCFCTNSICAPSRAVILTGKYSHLNGVYTNFHQLDPKQQTFPQLLHRAGYATAVVGKWGVGTDPVGFDYWGVGGGYIKGRLNEMGKQYVMQEYFTDGITDMAIEWIEGISKDNPFCFFCHYSAPHREWIPDAKHASMYEDFKVPEPETFYDEYKNRASAAAHARMRVGRDFQKKDIKVDPPPALSEVELKRWSYQRFIKDYLRCVASIDDNVGRLLDFLDHAGLKENTIVVYTSDQGFFLGDHGWYDKRFMYEEALRMPLLVRYPQEIRAGTVNSDIVLNLDFAPTLLDYGAAKVPSDMQGRSIRPLLRGETPSDWRTSMYYHYYEYPSGHMVRPHYGIRTMRYKLIHYYYQVDEWELFDLQADPREVQNLHGDPAYADIVKQLESELVRLRAEVGHEASLDKAYGMPTRKN